jgi:hypothetical protein
MFNEGEKLIQEMIENIGKSILDSVVLFQGSSQINGEV